jgi:tRNA threonylcarbamoyladenosine biosynthesis protein TsaE
MISRVWQADSVADIDVIAAAILEFASTHKLFLMHGEMGAGKTTLVKAFCKVLGVEETVNSPTFSIVHEYLSKQNETVYHFDLYRIKNQTELFDIGFEQYLDNGGYCFIEWPEKANGLLIQPKADIFITSENGHRVIECRYE